MKTAKSLMEDKILQFRYIGQEKKEAHPERIKSIIHDDHNNKLFNESKLEIYKILNEIKKFKDSRKNLEEKEKAERINSDCKKILDMVSKARDDSNDMRQLAMWVSNNLDVLSTGAMYEGDFPISESNQKNYDDEEEE